MSLFIVLGKGYQVSIGRSVNLLSAAVGVLLSVGSSHDVLFGKQSAAVRTAAAVLYQSLGGSFCPRQPDGCCVSMDNLHNLLSYSVFFFRISAMCAIYIWFMCLRVASTYLLSDSRHYLESPPLLRFALCRVALCFARICNTLI